MLWYYFSLSIRLTLPEEKTESLLVKTETNRAFGQKRIVLSSRRDESSGAKVGMDYKAGIETSIVVHSKSLKGIGSSLSVAVITHSSRRQLCKYQDVP